MDTHRDVFTGCHLRTKDATRVFIVDNLDGYWEVTMLHEFWFLVVSVLSYRSVEAVTDRFFESQTSGYQVQAVDRDTVRTLYTDTFKVSTTCIVGCYDTSTYGI